MYDWLKHIYTDLLPAVPSPFAWVSRFIGTYVWGPIKRTVSECQNALDLLGGEVTTAYNDRDWYVTRMRVRFTKIRTDAEARLTAEISAVKQAFADTYWFLIRSLREDLYYYVALVQAVANQALESITSFITNTFTPWRQWAEGQVSIITQALTNLGNLTADIANFWVSVYNGFRTELSAFLNDPDTYVLAKIEAGLGRHISRLVSMAVAVLDNIW